MKTELSEREKFVIQKIACGKSNKEIARELGLSVKTIEKFRENIIRKVKWVTGERNVGTALITHFAIARNLVELKFVIQATVVAA